MVRYVTGDLLHEDSPKAIVYGCNSAGSYGRGIPEQIYARWPDLYVVYKSFCRAEGRLGACFSWGFKTHTVFGLIIQKTWKSRANLQALRLAFACMLCKAETLGIAQVGVPRLGTGLNGLDWPDVKEVIEAVAAQSPIDVVVFDQFIPGKAP